MTKRFFLSLLAAFVVGLGLSGCPCSSTSRNLAGYWEAILSDGDYDGQPDEFPYHYLFLDITSHEWGLLSGQFYRQVGVTQSDTPLAGWTAGNTFRFCANFDGEILTFTGNLASLVQGLEGEHFVADWSSSNGQSGTVAFLSVNSHIVPEEPDAKAYAMASAEKGFVSEFASLGMDGGGGQPVIFVHGLLSSPSAWNDIVSKLSQEGYFAHYEFWRFGYDTRQPFETIGPEFYELAGEAGLRDRNPILVAHSMGGIVARSYIALGGGFSKLVTLGSPHVGTPTGAGGFFTGPGTLEMSPCTPELLALFASETAFDNFPDFAVVSGKITGHWQWVTVSQCSPVCAPIGPCCADVSLYLWQFDRDYNTALKAGWAFVMASGFGDNDGAVPTSSANFCVGEPDGWPCVVCPPIDYGHDKHLTHYDHFMLLNPAVAPDVYAFIIDHL